MNKKMKNLLLVLIVGTLLMSCSTREDEYRDWKHQDNPRIETLIEKLGSPTEVTNPIERYKTTILEFNDTYNPDFKTKEEYYSFYKDYFTKKTKIRDKYTTVYDQIKGVQDWDRDEYNEEIDKLNETLETFTYKESLYDRIERLKLILENPIGRKYSSPYNNALIGSGIDQDHVYNPETINWITYYFKIPLPEDEEINYVEFIVNMNNETGDFINGYNNRYYKYSFCDCLKFVGDELPKSCKERFKSTYGTEEPSANQMRQDYKNCR